MVIKETFYKTKLSLRTNYLKQKICIPKELKKRVLYNE